jgi:hypothetical protein
LPSLRLLAVRNFSYKEKVYAKNQLIKISAEGRATPQEILMWRNRVSETEKAFQSKLEEANAKIKQQFHNMDKQRGNYETSNTGLKQVKDETPTIIKPLKGNGHLTIKRASQIFSKDWHFLDQAVSHSEMFEIAVSDDVLINWKLDEIHELNELTKQTLPKGIKAEDIIFLTIEDFTGIADQTHGIEKRVNVVAVDQKFLTEHFGEGVDASFSIPEITDKNGGTLTYERNWKNNSSSLTMYVSKDLLKTEEGYKATLARLEDTVSSYAYELLQAGDKGIGYDKLMAKVNDKMDKFAYSEDLSNRPEFCFVGGTLIHTDKGLVPIKDIKVGDMVLSRDQHNPEGELVYKPVVRTIVTENVPVFYMNMTPESVDELPFHEQNNFNLYVDMLCTANHPIWINNKGWIKAGEVEMNDTSVLKTGELAFCEVGSSGEILEPVFFTKEPNVGFIPNFSNQTNNGKFVNLLTGKALYHGGYHPVFRKLFVEDTHWRKRLLEQTPAEYQDNAEFYGFRTGFWQDGAGIDWAEGEGPVTTTVYNIEVADTHTYFVGEHGVWVHNSDNCFDTTGTGEKMVAMLPNGGTGKVYYTRGLSKLNRAADIQTGMVGRLEKNSAATKLKNWFKFETSAEGVVLDINGNTIAHTLLYQNPKTRGIYYIKLGDSRVMINKVDSNQRPVIDDYGNIVREYSNFTRDSKASGKWDYIERKAEDQAQLLESLYRASKALDQNTERGHVIEFEKKGTTEKIMEFLADFKENPSAFDFSSLPDNMKGEWTQNLDWLHEDIYFADAVKGDVNIQNSRPLPETWYSIRTDASGVIKVQSFEQAKLIADGKLKAVKDMSPENAARDWMNSPQVQALLLANNGKLPQTLAEQLFGDIYTDTNANSANSNHTCFAAGTLVHTEQGLVTIEQLKVGDKVLSKNADGSGELVYKAVTKTMVTHNSPIFMMEFNVYVNPELDLADRVNLRRKLKKEITLPTSLFLTANHPIWTENRGWIKAQDLTQQDILVTKDSHRFVSNVGGGYEGRYEAIVPLYESGKEGYAYRINFGDDTGENLGAYINLSTGKNDCYDPDPKWIKKIWVNFDDWKQNLLDQTPTEHRDNVEFYGFRTGDWIDPDTVTWAEGEGPLTMTVYNIEVEDTHTYFVGEAGIWVHNCDTEPTYSNNLTVEQIQALVPAAKQYWINAGITEQELNNKLTNYQFEITQLQQNVAAVTDTDHAMIRFSPDASGYGWFIDNTPLDSK